MAGNAKFEELRRATNPLFNDRKLKLGTFCTNLSGGCAFTTMPGTLDITGPTRCGSRKSRTRWNSKPWCR